MQAFKAKGTQQLDDWEIAERVTDLKSLQPGEILLQVSHRFDAHNLCRIIALDDVAFRPPGELVYAEFVDPRDVTKKRLIDDREFAIWSHDLECGDEYFRVRSVDRLSLRS